MLGAGVDNWRRQLRREPGGSQTGGAGRLCGEAAAGEVVLAGTRDRRREPLGRRGCGVGE